MIAPQCLSDEYANEHESPEGPGDRRPTASQILRHEGLLTVPNRLTDKIVLVTGGTSGLGFEVARALCATGAAVYITGRCDLVKGQHIAAEISSSLPLAASASHVRNDGDLLHQRTTRHPVRFVHADLTDLASVRSGATDFLSQSNGRVHLLICNAGVMAPQKRELTEQGHELQFGVNHLAHFELFRQLCPALLKNSTEVLASRVITVSSCAHRNSDLLAADDYSFKETHYDPMIAYGQSKTANIYMANEIERRFGSQGLHGLSVHPGVIMDTGLVRHLTDDPRNLEAQFITAMPSLAQRSKSSQQGAGCIVWAAVAAGLEGLGGLYLEDCDVSHPVREDLDERSEWYEPGRSSWCYNQSASAKLWSDSEMLVSQ